MIRINLQDDTVKTEISRNTSLNITKSYSNEVYVDAIKTSEPTISGCSIYKKARWYQTIELNYIMFSILLVAHIIALWLY